MELVIGIVSTLNLLAVFLNAWLFRSSKSGVRNKLESEIVERAVALYKSLRMEYAEANERLQARVSELEKHELDNDELRHKVVSLTEHIGAMQTRERDYQDAIRRLSTEIVNLRDESDKLRASNIALENRLGRIEQEYWRTIEAQHATWGEERLAFIEQQRAMMEEIQELKRAI